MIFNLENSINERVILRHNEDVEVYLKREDAIHPIISGNKYRKLKYNVAFAKENNDGTLLTFGGAFSNHIIATAAAGKSAGLKTIGIIRGEELAKKTVHNETLEYAKRCGMHLKFVSREQFRDKSNPEFLNALENEFGSFYAVPEGGTNDLAVKGCEEILSEGDKSFDVVCASVGTGGTISGLINSSNPNQKILGFSALKGSFLQEDISKFANRKNWELITDYHFGGYAKIKPELITFINQFKAQNDIPLDPIYTGKMLFGISDLIKKGYFAKGTKILAIHTGGLQGIAGMNAILKQKELPLIQ
ncbi:1-aminocyclopropane-1-carboxylate deaminase/D-cysteine desulfhydrase [Bizionia gelidisalsuginis]|uniref:1-aminocyclopropane-1-carboxylate deaminase/D-cysteine desulfhydrase n=2 Tax=Bizionia TaxID=283785 RepID=A0A8H2QEJ2_9FLAO|nr:MULTISPECIES: pyridoxal-phosphate dependent enzyme [Bizionia]TYB72508.1 1-aminocyclopropane-1-carboxylate deaminase/D-cysteine desulfhydrase [Bizionia saleffrena]TYC09645.1 1-aminocyclopropane-1-carboxylate deaminase/D-cysteine desulfhydrase [Bizionia gelidisalsuginis]